MQHELTLEFLPSTTTGQLLCPLCGSLFEPLESVSLLDDGDLPIGYLCERCFMTGPRQAAKAVRERSSDLCKFADQARIELPPAERLAIMQAIQKRVERWNSLAERVEQLSWWELKGTASGQPI